jgi:CAI-1 autoinducer synthase
VDRALRGRVGVLNDGYLAQRIAAWDSRRTGWGGPLFHGRPAPGPGDLVLMSNDYLGFGHHPRVALAQAQAMLEQGNGLLMSGVLVGEADPMRVLEQRFARFLDAPAAMLCQSGWAANTGLIQTVAPPGRPVYIDAAAHASLWAGCQAAGARIVPFAHNDTSHLSRLVSRHGPGLIAVDTLYSVTGDFCPLTDLTELASATGCELILDESHTLGVVGPQGAGFAAALGLTGAAGVAYRTASLAKAFAGRAGLIACAAPVAGYVPFHSPSAVFSSTLLPHDIAGLTAVLDLIEGGDRRRARLYRIAAELRDGLTVLGYNITPSESQIISLRPGTEDRLCRLLSALDSRGVFGAPFAHPAVAMHNSALRLSVHAGLTGDDVARILDACASIRDEAGLATWKSTLRKERVTCMQ